MKRVQKSILALIILGGLVAFGIWHSNNSSQSLNSAAIKKASMHTQSPTPKTPAPTEQPKNIETKQVSQTESVPFQTVTEEDATLAKGLTAVATKGVNGIKTLVYRVTYTDGQETARDKISETITTQPVTQVIKIGNLPPGTPNPAGPAGASGVCMDGTLSFALHKLGACSHHGGIRLWY